MNTPDKELTDLLDDLVKNPRDVLTIKELMGIGKLPRSLFFMSRASEQINEISSGHPGAAAE